MKIKEKNSFDKLAKGLSLAILAMASNAAVSGTAPSVPNTSHYTQTTILSRSQFEGGGVQVLMTEFVDPSTKNFGLGFVIGTRFINQKGEPEEAHYASICDKSGLKTEQKIIIHNGQRKTTQAETKKENLESCLNSENATLVKFEQDSGIGKLGLEPFIKKAEQFKNSQKNNKPLSGFPDNLDPFKR